MPQALIVSPYLDHLGGGERYMLTLASVLEAEGYGLVFAWDNAADITRLCGMLGITLSAPRLVPELKRLYHTRNPLHSLRLTRPYDVTVYLSDGSVPWLGSRRNILHFQVPFHGVGGRSALTQFKLHRIHSVIVNSRFTKRVVDREYAIDSTVLYPPVVPVPQGEKSPLILSVGRFEPTLNPKKHDILIKAFRLLSPRLPGWELVLAGAGEDDSWLAHLKELAGGLPVRFAVNASYQELTALYGRASLYWHAAGYGVDEHKNPELTEHFGITTVEAISAGCLPLVVPRGGQREIVPDPSLQWETVPDLVQKTLVVTAAGYDRRVALASLDISPYTPAAFRAGLSEILA